MKLLQKFYQWLRPDGVLHLGVSALLFLILAPLSPLCRWWIPALVVFALGLGKEFYDSTNPAHCAEWHDVACDLIGIAGGIAIYFYILGLSELLW